MLSIGHHSFLDGSNYPVCERNTNNNSSFKKVCYYYYYYYFFFFSNSKILKILFTFLTPFPTRVPSIIIHSFAHPVNNTHYPNSRWFGFIIYFFSLVSFPLCSLHSRKKETGSSLNLKNPETWRFNCSLQPLMMRKAQKWTSGGCIEMEILQIYGIKSGGDGMLKTQGAGKILK